VRAEEHMMGVFVLSVTHPRFLSSFVSKSAEIVGALYYLIVGKLFLFVACARSFAHIHEQHIYLY
jgi:hypothetical protein